MAQGTRAPDAGSGGSAVSRALMTAGTAGCGKRRGVPAETRLAPSDLDPEVAGLGGESWLHVDRKADP